MLSQPINKEAMTAEKTGIKYTAGTERPIISNPGKSKPRIEKPAIKKLTKYNNIAPMKKLKNPKVSKSNGKEKNFSTGFRKREIRPKSRDESTNIFVLEYSKPGKKKVMTRNETAPNRKVLNNKE